jgi:hypothetical protein
VANRTRRRPRDLCTFHIDTLANTEYFCIVKYESAVFPTAEKGVSMKGVSIIMDHTYASLSSLLTCLKRSKKHIPPPGD